MFEGLFENRPQTEDSSNRVSFRMYRVAPSRTASALSRCASEELSIETGAWQHILLWRIRPNLATQFFRKSKVDGYPIGASITVSQSLG